MYISFGTLTNLINTYILYISLNKHNTYEIYTYISHFIEMENKTQKLNDYL